MTRRGFRRAAILSDSSAYWREHASKSLKISDVRHVSVSSKEEEADHDSLSLDFSSDSSPYWRERGSKSSKISDVRHVSFSSKEEEADHDSGSLDFSSDSSPYWRERGSKSSKISDVRHVSFSSKDEEADHVSASLDFSSDLSPYRREHGSKSLKISDVRHVSFSSKDEEADHVSVSLDFSSDLSPYRREHRSKSLKISDVRHVSFSSKEEEADDDSVSLDFSSDLSPYWREHGSKSLKISEVRHGSSFKEEDHRDSQDISSVVGTCCDMCPAAERAQRERLKDLSVFERLNGDPRKTSPNLAVKKFCRNLCIESIQASDIRPIHVLEITLKYLLNFLNSSPHPYEVVHDFIFDRTRSIRQDLTFQNIEDDRAIYMYEEMVKFYVLSHNKLAKQNNISNIKSLHCLNKEQLVKSLISLYGLYQINDTATIRGKAAEFYSLYILLQLGPDRQSMGESLSLWLRHLPSLVLKSKEMYLARRILRYVQIGNYLQFFRTIAAEASNLQFCLIEPSINEVRVQALSYINYGGYKLHPYPLARLSETLMMQESELESLCSACALETWTDESGAKFLPTKQTSFCLPKEGFQHYNFSGSVEKSTTFSHL